MDNGNDDLQLLLYLTCIIVAFIGYLRLVDPYHRRRTEEGKKPKFNKDDDTVYEFETIYRDDPLDTYELKVPGNKIYQHMNLWALHEIHQLKKFRAMVNGRLTHVFVDGKLVDPYVLVIGSHRMHFKRFVYIVPASELCRDNTLPSWTRAMAEPEKVTVSFQAHEWCQGRVENTFDKSPAKVFTRATFNRMIKEGKITVSSAREHDTLCKIGLIINDRKRELIEVWSYSNTLLSGALTIKSAEMVPIDIMSQRDVVENYNYELPWHFTDADCRRPAPKEPVIDDEIEEFNAKPDATEFKLNDIPELNDVISNLTGNVNALYASRRKTGKQYNYKVYRDDRGREWHDAMSDAEFIAGFCGMTNDYTPPCRDKPKRFAYDAYEDYEDTGRSLPSSSSRSSSSSRCNSDDSMSTDYSSSSSSSSYYSSSSSSSSSSSYSSSDSGGGGWDD